MGKGAMAVLRTPQASTNTLKSQSQFYQMFTTGHYLSTQLAICHPNLSQDHIV